MKKIVSVLLILGLTISFNSMPILAVNNISVVLDGTNLSFNVPPQIIGGRVMVPLRPIFEAMGALLEWDAASQTAKAVKGSTTVITQIGNNTATINGVKQYLDVPPTIIEGSTLASLRFVAEAFGSHARWDSSSQTAYITSAESSGQSDNSGQATLAEDFNTVGNTPGNIGNSGLVCQKGDLVYYSNIQDYDELYCMQTDGSGKRKICTDSAMYINVVQDWIFYSNGDDNRRIYRIKTDGSGRQKLTEDRAFFTTVAGDWVYYSNQNDGNKLYRVRTDGSEQQKLNDDYTCFINVAGDYLFYCNQSDGGKIYLIGKDGSRQEKISDVAADDLNLVGEWMYFCGSFGHLYRMHQDGSGLEELDSGVANGVNVSGDWVYYWGNQMIYRSKTDGSERQTLVDPGHATIYDLLVIGDWVYYYGWFDKERMYRIRTDGSGQEEFPRNDNPPFLRPFSS